MASDAVDDYQQLSDQLDDASSSLKKARKSNRSKKARDLAPEIDQAAERVGAVEADAQTEAQSDGPVESAAEAVAAGDVDAEGAAEAEEKPAKRRRTKRVADAANAEPHPDGIVTRDDEAGDDDAVDTRHAHLIDGPTLEALLFTTRHPLTPGRIGELMDVPSSKVLRAAIAALNETYEATARSFRIEQVAGGYQMLTLPQYGALLNKLHQREIDSKLTRSALETLSIIAYKQPVLRAEVEAIRGVASGETIRTLMEKHLVKIAGRAEIAGRPILYGTTKRFLEVFGLNSLKELPKEDQARPLPPHATAAAAHTPEHSVAAESSDVPVVTAEEAAAS